MNVIKRSWSALFVSIVIGLLAQFRTGEAQLTLDTDTGIDVTVFNHTVKFCENAHICGQCQPTAKYPHPNQATACGCDNLCEYFNDCCYDMEPSCAIPTADSDTFLQALNQSQILRDQISCVRPSDDGKRTEGVWMVSSCPQRMTDSEANRKCQRSVGSDLYESIPVTDTLGLTYKNVHCGVCHGVPTTDLTLWDINAHCNKQTSSSLHEMINNNAPFLQIIQLLSQNCTLSFSSPDSAGPLGKRSCVQQDVVTECAHGVPDNIFDICQMYTAYILDRDEEDQGDSSLEGHRNPHCFYCSHGFTYDVMNCDLPIPIVDAGETDMLPGQPKAPAIIPISALVNFYPDGSVSVTVDKSVVRQAEIRCPVGAVFDPFSGICRHLSCPTGSHLVGDICVPFAESTGCSTANLFLGLNVIVNIDRYDETSPLQQQVKMCLMNVLHINLLEVTNVLTSRLKPSKYFQRLQTVQNIANNDVSIAQFYFQIETNNMSIMDLDEVFDYAFLQPKYGTGSDDLCGVIVATVSQMCSPMSNCSTMEMTSEFSFVTIGNASFIFANDTSQVYHILEPKLHITYARPDSNDIRFSKLQEAILCDDPLSCPLVTLKESQFEVVNRTTGSLLHVASGMVYEMSEYQLAPNGDIQVCSFFNSTGIKNFTDVVSFVAYSKPQVIVTLIGYIFSILGEIATFLTYYMFRSIRNRTAYAIMNLVVALFLGQLLLLVGGGRTQPKELCTTVAILLHYFFLSTFSWSTVLSYDLHRIFGTDTAPVRVDGNRKMLASHMIYAWCSPIVIILPCVVVHFCSCTNLMFQYGSSMSCWINNEYANLLVFGLPILVALLFNIYFFCRTVWAIHLSKRETANRAPAETARKKKYQELMIYAKIASLMGFTWIFAFIAAFTGMEAFWYIYIVLNSFQGLYIFLAFTANSMVWELWKKKLPDRFFGPPSGGSIQNVNGRANQRSAGGPGSSGARVGEGDMNNITRPADPSGNSSSKQTDIIPSDTPM